MTADLSFDLPADKNIVITGFMGTGKTTVGRLLAQRLGRPFYDMDEQIEAHFGKPIPRIFAEDGEPAFRVAEAQVCDAFAQQQGAVISTGGGALVNPGNRQRLAESGILICLTATVETILARVDQTGDRPLLASDRDELRQRVRHLLHERRHAYAAIAHQVDTSGRSPDAIVDDILLALQSETESPGMTRIPVREPEGIYDICIADTLLEQSGRLMQRRGLRPGPVAIVSNPEIAEHLAARLTTGLAAAGYEPTVCLVPEGEQHKTLASIASLYDQFVAARIDRKSAVIALGGGVIGDMAGFAAATFLRGLPFVQVPTSLLAMVDSSVGGKTGVDLPQGKNLVGAFKQPRLVIIDPTVLASLPGTEVRAGLAEIIKHGILGHADLFCQLEEHGPTSIAQMVADAVRVKVRVVEEDPYEQGVRATLNLGHTFGHAIELVSGFKVRHGEGVALGLIASANMAVALERCSPQLAQRIAQVIERVGLPTAITGYSQEAVLNAMQTDKKRAGKTLRFIIPQALEDVAIIDDPGRDVVQAALATVLT